VDESASFHHGSQRLSLRTRQFKSKVVKPPAPGPFVPDGVAGDLISKPQGWFNVFFSFFLFK
jgi:hypothetical protein